MSSAYTGLFEWSIKNQDTNKTSDAHQPRQVSEEDRIWFQEAMEAHTEDIYKRLRGIKDALESKADVPEDVDEKLRLLDDLTEIVESIDYARGQSICHRRPELWYGIFNVCESQCVDVLWLWLDAHQYMQRMHYSNPQQ